VGIKIAMVTKIKIVVILALLVTSSFASWSEEIKSKFTYHGREVQVSTDFDNGGLARIEESETNVFDCWPYDENEYMKGWIYLESTVPGQYDFAAFTFHFCVDGCRGKKITFNFHIRESVNKESDSVISTNPDFPVMSYDECTWQRMEVKSLKVDPSDENWKIVSVEHIFSENYAHIAFQYPYSNNYLDRLIHRIQNSPFCTIKTAGHSTEGRDIRLISITDPEIPFNKKLVAWFTGLQHCAESGAGWGLEFMIDFLLSDDPIAREARAMYLLNIIPIVNVDAVSEGRGRIHSTGRNLNREWENNDPVAEIRTIKRTMEEWLFGGNIIDIFIDFHGFSAQYGRWYVMIPEESDIENQSEDYQVLTDRIKKYLPRAISYPYTSLGYAAGAASRQLGAVSLTIDGFIYDWWHTNKEPDLSAFYSAGNEIWSFDDMRESAEKYVYAFVEYGRWKKRLWVETERVLSLSLSPNYPNPFNSVTTIPYILSQSGRVTVRIFNDVGQEVITLFNGIQNPGYHGITWDGRDGYGRDLESGVYLVTLQAGGENTTGKIMLLK